jgi:hypothetical protein
MTTLVNITVSEFETLARTSMLPSDTPLTIKIEGDHTNLQLIKRQKALSAMHKLKGSGNGCLVDALLKERRKEKRL